MEIQPNRISSKELEQKGFMIQKMTEKDWIVKLIESLHPVQTQNELIRLGPNGDGGYLVPNDLDGIEACYSPGVDTMSEFELACLKHGMNIYMADGSVEKPNIDLPEDQYSFIKKYIGCLNNDVYTTLDDWVKSTSSTETTDLLLQMDIEGGEYHSLMNLSSSLLNRFRIMAIEFHSLDQLWDPYFFYFAKPIFDKILQTHVCVHIHPNNCQRTSSKLGVEIPVVAEFTFLRKDRIKTMSYASNFPHSLDYDNTPNEHIVLPQNWYKAD